MDVSSFVFGIVNHGQKHYSKVIGDYTLYIYVGMWTILSSMPQDPDLNINQYSSVGVEIVNNKGQVLSAYELALLKLDKLGLTQIFYDASFRDVSIPQVEAIWIILENEANKNSSYSLTNQFANSYNIFGYDDEDEQEVITKTEPLSSFDDKVGGICSVCKADDPWNSWKNGKCYCYKHVPGY
jgi:hypothetical protein